MSDRVFRLRKVEQMADESYGKKVWDFNQTLPFNYIQDSTKDGICLALSCYWIKHHALGSSLMNFLGGIGNVNPRNPREGIRFNHQGFKDIANFQSLVSLLPEWNEACKIMLQKYVLPSTESVGVAIDFPSLKKELKGKLNTYMLINIYNSDNRDGHAIAVYIPKNGKDIQFFDPNYGEYIFQNNLEFHFFLHFFVCNFYKNEYDYNKYQFIYFKPQAN